MCACKLSSSRTYYVITFHKNKQKKPTAWDDCMKAYYFDVCLFNYKMSTLLTRWGKKNGV